MALDALRDTRNREALAAHQLDAVICRLPENVLLLTGYWPLSSAAFVVFPCDGDPLLIVVDTEERDVPAGAVDEVRTVPWGSLDGSDPRAPLETYLRDAISQKGLHGATIGIELGFEFVAPGHGAGEVSVPAAATQALFAAVAPEATLVDAGPALNTARARKTPDEIDKLRQAHRIAAFGLEAFHAFYEPGRSEAEVAAQVEAAIMSRGIGHDGARHVRAWAQLMTGPESAWAFSLHPATSARRIERGDLGVLELGTVVDGYWSDLTRTLVAGGAPTDRQQAMYDAILAARGAVLREARPGMTGGEIDGLARAAIVERGYGDLFVHQTGHGLGFRYHEPIPQLHPMNRSAVEAGMVSSVEPGLYQEGFGGMRLEENVLFSEEGVELLSVFSTALVAENSLRVPQSSPT